MRVLIVNNLMIILEKSSEWINIAIMLSLYILTGKRCLYSIAKEGVRITIIISSSLAWQNGHILYRLLYLANVHPQ